MNENTLKTRLDRVLKRRHPTIWIWRIAERFSNGIPDTLYITEKGVILWVEYKIHPNKPTPMQRYAINNLLTHQQKVGIVTMHTQDKYTIEDGTKTITTVNPITWIEQTLGLIPPPLKEE